jgi:hypothetical protein
MVTRSEYIIYSMYNNFMYNTFHTTIAKYYGIQDKNLNIVLNPHGKNFLLSFNYDKKIKYTQFTNLPDDINNEIYSFLYPNYIHVTYEISFDNDYPFYPPMWSLYSVDYKCSTVYDVNIPEYYNYIIQNHNEESNRQWSPAIKLEQEFLRLIIRLNHFHHFF